MPGLDREAPTIFVLEGLIHYLSAERFAALLDELAVLAPRRRVVLSFIRSEMYAAADSLFIRLVQALREVPRLHFETAALHDALARSGLRGVESWTGEAQVERFAPEARGRPLRLSQDVAHGGT